MRTSNGNHPRNSQVEFSSPRYDPPLIDQIGSDLLINSLPIDSSYRFVGRLMEVIQPDHRIFTCLIERLSSESFRTATLEILHQMPWLLSPAKVRGQLLNALQPYAAEPLVGKLAAATFEYQGIPSMRDFPYGEASAIIRKGSHHIDPQIRRSLFRYLYKCPTIDGNGEHEAIELLRISPLGPAEMREVGNRAYSWYVDQPGRSNPWISILAEHPGGVSLQTFIKILRGGEPPSDRPSKTERKATATANSAVAAAIELTIALGIHGARLGPLLSSAATFGVSTTASHVVIRRAARAKDLMEREVEHLETVDAVGQTYRELESGQLLHLKRVEHRTRKLLYSLSRDRRRPESVRERADDILRGK